MIIYTAPIQSEYMMVRQIPEGYTMPLVAEKIVY